MKQGARFAHISDLHLGRSAENDANAERLCAALVAFGIDQVIATGDLTHRGLERELEIFDSMFAPLANQGRLVVVPGNHDCLGDDVSGRLMSGPRVQVTARPGLYVVRVNSTAPRNRSWINGHGSLDDADLDAIDVALDAAPAGALVVVALHHHVLPMPEEHVAERVSNWLGFQFTSELRKGRDLLQRVRGKCDLVLHGHRHVPRGVRLFGPRAPSTSSTPVRMARVRVFHHDGAGQLALPHAIWPVTGRPWPGLIQSADAGDSRQPSAGQSGDHPRAAAGPQGRHARGAGQGDRHEQADGRQDHRRHDPRRRGRGGQDRRRGAAGGGPAG